MINVKCCMVFSLINKSTPRDQYTCRLKILRDKHKMFPYLPVLKRKKRSTLSVSVAVVSDASWLTAVWVC